MRQNFIPAEDILALTADIAAHRAGGPDITFANALFAEFGSASSVGRLIEHFGTLNTYMPIALEELPAVRRLSLHVVHDPKPGSPPTSAAAEMVANPHERRISLRRVPMPPATRQAALAYARERLTLIDRTLAMVHSKSVLKEQRNWLRLFECLDGDPAPFRPATRPRRPANPRLQTTPLSEAEIAAIVEEAVAEAEGSDARADHHHRGHRARRTGARGRDFRRRG